MDPRALFVTFTQEEANELASELVQPTGQQGGAFHRQHYFDLEKEFKKAPKILDDNELELFYFHYVRKGHLPWKGLEKTYQIWEDAYRRQMVYMNKKQYDLLHTKWNRLKGLLIFGFD